MKRIMTLFLARLIVLQLAFASHSFACMRGWAPANNLPEKLISFGSCEALEKHINKINEYDRPSRVRKKGSMISQLQNRLGSTGRREAKSAAFRATEDLVMSEAIPKPMTVIGTNNQVARVDEADFVKFNGQHIFQLHKGTLKILKAWPANAMNLISSLKVEGAPQEMLVNESHAVVMAVRSERLIASLYDIQNVNEPNLVTRFEIPGTYKTARLVGDTLRVVNYEHMNRGMFWKTGKTVTQPNWFQTPRSPRKELNIKPTIQVTGQNKREIDTTDNCKNVWVPEKSYAQVLTRLIRIDLKQKQYDETLAFVNPMTVYTSEKNIYLTATGRNRAFDWGFQKTAIHQFGIEAGVQAGYRSTGVVNGTLVNQFAMDEHKGHLRVATNGSEKNEKGQWNQVSRIHILKQSGRKLVKVSESAEMGRGERLYSVRFDGDKGYVVTFRQVDPLYTLDLSNPKKPQVVGELKIPGFSTYIHKLDSTHLLTIGKDADPKTGRARGMKLSVFDVSNFAHPREVKSLLFKKNVSSEATYEHKAFSFYRDKGVLAIPATTQNEASALLLFKVSQEDIQFTGELDMTDMFSHINNQSTVRRSFFADDVVYAIGESGVRAAELSRPQNPLSTVHFDKKMAQITW